MKHNIEFDWRWLDKPKETYKYDFPNGWVFRMLDTPPYYNVLISDKTLRKVKKLLKGPYKCKIEPSINGKSDDGQNMWVLTKCTSLC